MENPTHRDSDQTNRVYSKNGSKAHTVWTGRSDSEPCIYCGRLPASPWLGTGSQKEIEKALSLPYCKEKE